VLKEITNIFIPNDSSLPSPDPDPYTSCSEHGTHVAGIVGADMNPYNFTGVAPDATIGMYRVFGCDGTAGDDVLIDAFIRAHNDHPDVITASIGGSDGWTGKLYQIINSGISANQSQRTLGPW
jgi:subtilisin family serine protease